MMTGKENRDLRTIKLSDADRRSGLPAQMPLGWKSDIAAGMLRRLEPKVHRS